MHYIDKNGLWDETRLWEDMYCYHISHSLFDLTHPDIQKNGPEFYAGILNNLERFVDYILSIKQVYLEATPEQVKNNERYIQGFIDTIKMLSSNIEYSERIQAFRIYCSDKLSTSDTPDNYQRFVVNILHLCKSNRLQETIAIKKHNSYKRFIDYEKYVNTLHKTYPNVDALELRLYYKQNLLNIRTARDASRDLESFFSAKRDNSIFKGMVGYISKLAYNDSNGIHCHLILFYNELRQNHFHHTHLLSHLIDYWKNTITNGEGGDQEIKLISESTSPRLFRKNPRKSALYPDLLLLIELLCHVDRFIKPKDSEGVHLIRRGHYPTKNTSGSKLRKTRKKITASKIGVNYRNRMIENTTHPPHAHTLQHKRE